MDIEHFYDANPRRRSSTEYSFGRDWTDPGGIRWELNWVQDTGEVYVMRETGEALMMDPLGDVTVPHLETTEVTVEILGVVDDLDAVENTFGGWSQAMDQDSSLDWVRTRMTEAIEGDAPARAHDGSDPPPSSLAGAD